MTTAERLRAYWADRRIDRERLATLTTGFGVVAALVAGLVVIALVMRLWGLDWRAIHHDESIHLKFSWDLFKGRDYIHSPTYHGPFEIAGTAAIFRVFGDSDFTGRLLPALFGTLLVGLPFLLRRYIGWVGAVAAAGLLAVSPMLLYFSRFARNDIYIAVFTLGLAIVIWRYLKEQKEAYLFAVPFLMMLGFVTKEVTFITTAVFLIYLEVQLATDLVDQMRASRPMRPVETALAYAVLLPLAWLVAALWPLLPGQRKRWSLTALPPAGHLMVIMGTFALPQFAAAVQKVPEFAAGIPAIGDGLVSGLGLDALQDEHAAACKSDGQCGFSLHEGEQALRMLTVFFAIAGTAAIGTLWNKRVWLISAAIFYIPYFFLYTTFFQNGGDLWNLGSGGTFWQGEGGFWSGIWGSLDYWLLQQFDRRGNQPDYYYFILLPVYEFLPLVFALGGALFYAFRGKVEQQLLAASALLLILAFSLMPSDTPLVGSYHIHLSFLIAIIATLVLPMDGLFKFLLFWALAMLYGITVAGEKMPWLAVHVAVPLALLAGKVLDDILSPVFERPRAPAAGEAKAPRRAAKREMEAEPPARQTTLLLLALGLVVAIAAAVIFQAVGPASGLSALGWMLAAVAFGAMLWAAMSVSWRAAGQVAATALFAALLVFTIRAGGFAAFDQGDPGNAPPELLIYAQGSPDLGNLMDEIDDLARTSGKGRDLRIVLDNSEGTNIWPWPWYLRNYERGGLSYTNFMDDFVPDPGSVLLASSTNAAKIEPYIDKVDHRQDYRHMWWFHEDYRGLQSPTGFLGDLLRGRFTSTWRTYFIDRRVPGAFENPDRIAYFFGEFDPITANPTRAIKEGILDGAAQTVIGEPGTDPGQLSQPADIALDSEGNIYIVDTLNQRVQKFAPDGTFITAVGQVGDGEGEFADPSADGFAPDGPWGIGIDSAGNVYVADTWNHRIQKFSSDLEFLLEWQGGEGNDLFGPRDVAIDADGNVLVADTGNNRIVKFTTEGELIEVYGQQGTAPGQFNEPTSISIAPNGDIYVADFWNKRIQHFDPSFIYIGETPVDTWPRKEITGVTDRSYIVALEDGTLLATDPIGGRIMVFDAEGEWQAAWRFTQPAVASRPVGVTMDAAGSVYVSDALGLSDAADPEAEERGIVRKIPLTALLPEGEPAAAE